MTMNDFIGSLRARAINGMQGLLVLGSLCMCAAAAAHACACDPLSPEAGFDHAQYVFAGQVVRAQSHTWLVEVERAWKGEDKLTHVVRLMDVYAGIDCEFYFELGRRYVFFTILAKGGRAVFYHPQACNWTRPLHSARVLAGDNESLWLEDLIVREHGPGATPRAKRSSSVEERDSPSRQVKASNRR